MQRHADGEDEREHLETVESPTEVRSNTAVTSNQFAEATDSPDRVKVLSRKLRPYKGL